MPDGTSSVTPASQHARRTLQRIHRWVRPFWHNRLILVAGALFLFSLTASQTAEFMDGVLLSCLSADCLAIGHRGISPVQFFVFMIVCCGFAVLMWHLGRPASRPADGAARPGVRSMAHWVPAGIGGLCIVAACMVLIEHSRSSPHAGPVLLWPAASFFAGCAGAIWLARSQHPQRQLIVSLVAIGFGLLAFRPFVQDQEWANYFVPALSLIVAYCLLRPAPSWRKLSLKDALLLWLFPCFAIVFACGFGALALAAYLGGRVQVWAFPFVLLLPAGYGLLVGRTVARSVERPLSPKAVSDVPDAARPQETKGQDRLEAGAVSTVPGVARPQETRRQGPLYWGVVAVFGLIAFFGNLWPVQTARAVIAPTAMVAFIAIALLLVRVFIQYVPRPVRWLALSLYVLLLFVRGVPPAPLRTAAAPIDAKPCAEARSICDSELAVQRFWADWSRQRPAAPDAPVLLVAAAGGGARAAAHTSAVLAAVDAATCGAFGDRIFAISGVSGGAVGSALYAASRADLITSAERAECKARRPGERPAWLMPRLIDASAGDHLSAPLLRTLFRDFPMSLLMLRRAPGQQENEDYASRAGALKQAWMESYASLSTSNPRVKASGNTFSTLTPNGDKSPLLLFNATSVQDGMRVLLNHASMCPGDSWCGGKGRSYLSMAIDSARFPLVTPAASYDVFGWEPYSGRPMLTERSIVDGGYFDNTGVSTLLDVMDGLEAAKVARNRIFAILITSDPQEGQATESVRDFSDQGLLSQLLGPVSTVVQTRDGRSRLAVRELQRRLGSCNVLYWSLSRKTLNPLTVAMREVIKSDPEGDASRVLHGKPDLVRERDPALGWALSRRSGDQLLSFARARALPFEFGEFAHANDQMLASKLGIPVSQPESGEDTCMR